MDVKNLRINLKRFVAGASIAFVLASSAACAAKTSDCTIMPEHVHVYEKEGIVRYIEDEDLDVDGFKWTKEIRYVDEDELKEIQLEEKKDLIRIEDNIEYIEKYQKENDKVIEYEYKEIVLKPIPHVMFNGKSSYTIVVDEAVPEYHWTTDKTHEGLTGEVRERSTEYVGYRIVHNGDKTTIEKSEPVGSLLEIKDEYPYFKESSFKPVYNYKVDLQNTNTVGL